MHHLSLTHSLLNCFICLFYSLNLIILGYLLLSFKFSLVYLVHLFTYDIYLFIPLLLLLLLLFILGLFIFNYFNYLLFIISFNKSIHVYVL